MNVPKPRVFVGSATEGLAIARAVQMELSDDAEVTVWNQGVFSLGKSALESVLAASQEFDFAILVIRADDVVIKRNLRSPAARDNIWFEIGVFAGRIGSGRTFVFYDCASNPSIISDLGGIMFATYDGADANLHRAVSPACTKVRIQMASALLPKEEWYTEFRLGRNLYKETLRFNEISPEIVGVKIYEQSGGKTTLYSLRGYRGRGFDWLEYHSKDGDGGGAIILRHIGAGAARGLIIAGHCDTGALRCYENRWIRPGAGPYNPDWLHTIADSL
jgi:Predicted nucleotide-binding protein containing TIR-like domain